MQHTGTAPRGLASGVIWITGYSSAGKTTIGRRVESLIKARGHSTLFLDGDHLRSIFGSHFGYEKSQRKELAKIYIRLCSHLSAQGHVVILSAIAMYDEVEQWMRTIVPRSMQVFLDVPRDVRMRRDNNTKGVYADPTAAESNYDTPKHADITLVNGEGSDIDLLAQQIADHYLNRVQANIDIGRKEHWDRYYGQRVVANDPSPFATSVAEVIGARGRLLEVGCGNGRDAFFFASQGHSVVGLDLSRQALEECRRKAAETQGLALEFFQGSAADYAETGAQEHDVVYSRFVLHAMTLQEEIHTLAAAFAVLRNGGRLYVECRSINDPLALKGEIISPTERIDGHYRRFIVREELLQRVTDAGFVVENCVESRGFAVSGTDDPTLIRLVAAKAG